MKIKRLLFVLSLCLLMAACETGVPDTSSRESEGLQSSAPMESSHEESSGPDVDNEAKNSANPEPAVELSDEQRFNEIMCIFGAKRKTEYNTQGEPIESDAVEYQTSVISFYYHDEGVPSIADITHYGYFGWYLEYTSDWEEKISKVFPNFERMVLIRNDPVSGEIYGAPADFYEAIVTSFFDVDVEELQSNDLYDKEAKAYIPITGPGRGEQPIVRVASGKREGNLIILDITVESRPEHTFQLTVREDKSNRLEGIKFISLM